MDLTSYRRPSSSTLKVSGRSNATASYAQQRIWLHEKLYFDHLSSSPAMYNILLPLRIKCGILPVEHVQFALLSVLEKHKVLRTAVRFNKETNQLEQEIQPLSRNIYSFERTQNISSSEQLDDILTTEIVTNYFDVEQGKVVRCHLIQINNDCDLENLHMGDLLLFTIHHIAFDNSSLRLFTLAFAEACGQFKYVQSLQKAPQYIDFTLYEQSFLKSTEAERARKFWASLLKGYDWTKTSIQPIDTAQTTKSIRSGRGYSIAFNLENDLVQAQMAFAASHNISMFQLYLACYYVFLFKLGAIQDLCVAATYNNRPLSEMKSMIGMFANTIPYRINMDPHDSFEKLVIQVQHLCLAILSDAHLPYQQILGVQANERYPMPETFFHYESLLTSTTYNTTAEIPTNNKNGTVFDIYYDRDRSHGNGIALFDMTLAVSHGHHAQVTECFLECSADLFSDETIVKQMTERFQSLLRQLFIDQKYDLSKTPINQLSLLLPSERNELQSTVFKRLPNINEGPASFAQARIWSEENNLAINNMPFVFHIERGSLTVERLKRAFQLVIMKHESLRTALIFDNDHQQLMQHIRHLKDDQDLFSFTESTDIHRQDLMRILHDERGNSCHFDLEKGLVSRLHILYQNSKKDQIERGDSIIFNFHHALFDFPSMHIFYDDLNDAYTNGYLHYDDEKQLRYLDYSMIEREMSMTMAKNYWIETLRDYDLNRSLPLPFDRYRISNEQQRTGRGTSISFDFNEDLSQEFLSYSLDNDVTLEEVSLTCYFLFLFKLTNGEEDLCIGMNVRGRYKNELKSLIGMFVNAIPLRLRDFNSSKSFSHLIQQVKQMTRSAMEMSHFPLQRILSQHFNNEIRSESFLDTSFEYEILENRSSLCIDEVKLSLVPYSLHVGKDEIVSKFDFSLRILHNPINQQFSCEIDASLDLFDRLTIDLIGQRFHHLLQQLFLFSTFDLIEQPIVEVSLLLSDDLQQIQSINQTSSMSFHQLDQVHEEFVHQTFLHPQKISICLEEQSLTYAELFYKVDQLVHRMGERKHVNEIVCQCVERSIEMIIGELAIISSGRCYCALSPEDPPARLSTLVTQTKSSLILVHSSTQNHFLNHSNVINIQHCLLDDINVTDVTDHHRSVSFDDLVYVVFTSGSTGIPKAVQISHKNFSSCMTSFKQLNIITSRDVVVQMAQCSFDVHVKECLGTMMLGATLVLLRPHGYMDFKYLSKTLHEHNVTFFSVVPTMMTAFRIVQKERDRWPITEGWGRWRARVAE
ncbi:unnamed protein product [Adineta ricciae]|uniref:Uncharacterized protein n=1 Tax=Adineta ricciae TaxID=249248 RepID=A0A815JKS1_ADIRI|nr:unnamed protein product [Adineta ricciae]CAF1379202.1 unnamed protein product [Adineta ricciae]